jgi:hypothetical protein
MKNIYRNHSVDYSDLCFELSKVKVWQEYSFDNLHIEPEFDTFFSKQLAVHLYLEQCRFLGQLVVDGRRPFSNKEICFYKKRKYFVEKSDFKKFCAKKSFEFPSIWN